MNHLKIQLKKEENHKGKHIFIFWAIILTFFSLIIKKITEGNSNFVHNDIPKVQHKNTLESKDSLVVPYQSNMTIPMLSSQHNPKSKQSFMTFYGSKEESAINDNNVN